MEVSHETSSGTPLALASCFAVSTCSGGVSVAGLSKMLLAPPRMAPATALLSGDVRASITTGTAIARATAASAGANERPDSTENISITGVAVCSAASTMGTM